MPLVLVGTPIGNLDDLAPRAVEALRTASVICCEDTRRTGRLLQHAGIPRVPFVVVNDHTERSAISGLLDRLAAGERVVVVTDAGMPGISDPGERLVRAALDAGHAIEVVPGPSAAVAALVTSGLPAGRFVFEGFLPRKGAVRAQRLAEVAAERRTVVLYEAPHRLARTLADLAAACGEDRPVAIGRELTKLHEETWRGTLGDALGWVAERAPRGELVVVLAGAAAPEPTSTADLEDALRRELGAGASAKDASATVADALGVSRRTAYEAATRIRREAEPRA